MGELLDLEAIITGSKPVIKDFKKGVYFLIDGAEIVYIGQTKDFNSRLTVHIREGQKVFDKYFFIDTEDLDVLEAKYILHYRPKYNVSMPHRFVMSHSEFHSRTLNTLVGRMAAVHRKQGRRLGRISEIGKEQWINQVKNKIGFEETVCQDLVRLSLKEVQEKIKTEYGYSFKNKNQYHE